MRKIRKKFVRRLFELGMDPIRNNFGQGLQHKFPFVQPRMRHSQLRSFNDPIIVRKQIQIDDPRLRGLMFRRPAAIRLDFFHLMK